MKGGNHYILDKYIPTGTSTPSFSFLKEDTSNSYYQDEILIRAFERVSSTVTISPAYITATCISTTYCYDAGEKATIIWKSHLFSFWINKLFTLSNIIIDGSDMFPYYGYNSGGGGQFIKTSEYAYRKTKCCICDVAGNCSQDSTLTSGGTCLCGLKNSQLPINIMSNTYQQYNSFGSTGFHWYKRPYGMFNMEFLSDYTSASNPKLVIQVIEFIYDMYIYYI